jgi:CBS domain-containing protein
MKLKDAMTSQVQVVRPDASIQEAAEKMRSLDVGALPVCDGPRLIGMITDRDITIRATAQACDPEATLVRDILSPELVYAFEDQDLEEAEQLMQEKQIRRLPVLSRDQQLVGIVALADVVAEAGKKDVARTVQAVSKPS